MVQDTCLCLSATPYIQTQSSRSSNSMVLAPGNVLGGWCMSIEALTMVMQKVWFNKPHTMQACTCMRQTGHLVQSSRGVVWCMFA